VNLLCKPPVLSLLLVKYFNREKRLSSDFRMLLQVKNSLGKSMSVAARQLGMPNTNLSAHSCALNTRPCRGLDKSKVNFSQL
jgi:hypothetical protein